MTEFITRIHPRNKIGPSKNNRKQGENHRPRSTTGNYHFHNIMNCLGNGAENLTSQLTSTSSWSPLHCPFVRESKVCFFFFFFDVLLNFFTDKVDESGVSSVSSVKLFSFFFFLLTFGVYFCTEPGSCPHTLSTTSPTDSKVTFSPLSPWTVMSGTIL